MQALTSIPGCLCYLNHVLGHVIRGFTCLHSTAASLGLRGPMNRIGVHVSTDRKYAKLVHRNCTAIHQLQRPDYSCRTEQGENWVWLKNVSQLDNT